LIVLDLFIGISEGCKLPNDRGMVDSSDKEKKQANPTSTGFLILINK